MQVISASRRGSVKIDIVIRNGVTKSPKDLPDMQIKLPFDSLVRESLTRSIPSASDSPSSANICHSFDSLSPRAICFALGGDREDDLRGFLRAPREGLRETLLAGMEDLDLLPLPRNECPLGAKGVLDLDFETNLEDSGVLLRLIVVYVEINVAY
jgi:hypothetical protein